MLSELKGPVGQMIQTDNRGLLAVERNKVTISTETNSRLLISSFHVSSESVKIQPLCSHNVLFLNFSVLHASPPY